MEVTNKVKLKRMSKQPFLKPHHVVEDDLLEILDEPWTQSAEESKFGRERGYVTVRLIRTGETFTWGLNGTTWDRLIDAFGEDGGLWKGKRVKMRLETQTIRGEPKQIMYGVAYVEPQRCLDKGERGPSMKAFDKSDGA
jgi:hypothetical protein